VIKQPKIGFSVFCRNLLLQVGSGLIVLPVMLFILAVCSANKDETGLMLSGVLWLYAIYLGANSINAFVLLRRGENRIRAYVLASFRLIVTTTLVFTFVEGISLASYLNITKLPLFLLYLSVSALVAMIPVGLLLSVVHFFLLKFARIMPLSNIATSCAQG
jgi:hypothetical protein